MSGPIPTRPLLRWHGGKWRLAPWIIAHFPPHRVYVEPFGGAASVLMRKPRAYAEIYNDLDDDLVALFRLLRDPPSAAELVRRLRLTPFARSEFDAAYSNDGDAIEVARRMIVRSFMGFGSDSTAGHYRTGFRCTSNRSGTTPAHDWANYHDALLATIERLSGVVIEHAPAGDVMRRFDGPDVLHYVDPPYLPETRSSGNRRRCGPGTPGHAVYRHELTDSDHEALLGQLGELTGMVVLSGYPADKYDQALPGWERVERRAYADGAAPRTEVLWINPACWARIRETGLFEVAA